MRISDWSSDVCSSDLRARGISKIAADAQHLRGGDPWGNRHATGKGFPCLICRGVTQRRGYVSGLDDIPRERDQYPHARPRTAEPRNVAGLGDDVQAVWKLQAGRMGNRKSVVWGKSVSVRVGLGGRRLM